jgi:hypothetical protein
MPSNVPLKSGYPAFPSNNYSGLGIRDYFACQLQAAWIQALGTQHRSVDDLHELSAKLAVDSADALIEEINRVDSLKAFVLGETSHVE